MGTHIERGGAVLTVDQRFSTYDEYLAWAETRPDEERYEIVDGYPVMSPGPGYLHQLCQSNLLRLLFASVPDDFVVLAAPFDWVLWETPRLQMREPDLLVIRRPADLSTRRIEEPPLLAIEIVSESSVERDLVTKRNEYGRAGLDHYWVVDPAAPQIAVYRRRGGVLELTTLVNGDDLLSVTEPFEVQLRPADLIH